LPVIALVVLWAGTPGIARRLDGPRQAWPERPLVEASDPHAAAAALPALLAASPTERTATVVTARDRIAGSTTSDLAPFLRGVLRSAAAGRSV
jgi:hypothetical protein